MKIDPASPEHPYVRVRDPIAIKDRGGGDRGGTLPSIMELTEETGLSINTVRRAIKVLVDEGLAYTVPGRGTFVRDR